MRILLLTIDFPLPVNAGGVMRLLGIAEALAARGHDLHLLAKLRDPHTDPALPGELSRRLGGAPVEAFGASHFPPPPGALRAAGRWAYALGTRTPPWVWSAYSRALAARARALAPAFDVCLMLDDHAHTFALDLRGLIPTVLDMQNVMAASWNATNHWGGGSPTPAQRVQQAVAFRLVRAWEHRVSAAAGAVVVTSADEAARFRAHHGLACDWVGSAIATPPALADPLGAPPHVLWLGDHRYHANEDGLVRFLRDGWPPLGRRGLRLQVIGRDAGAEVRRLARSVPGVDLLGFVPDLDPHLASAAAAVVPVWAGAGIKMKTLVLMGAGLPVASTGVGIEGIAAADGEHVLLGDTPQALADAIGRLVDDRERAAAVGAAGRALILSGHTWDGVVPQLETILGRAARARG